MYNLGDIPAGNFVQDTFSRFTQDCRGFRQGHFQVWQDDPRDCILCYIVCPYFRQACKKMYWHRKKSRQASCQYQNTNSYIKDPSRQYLLFMPPKMCNVMYANVCLQASTISPYYFFLLSPSSQAIPNTRTSSHQLQTIAQTKPNHAT